MFILNKTVLVQHYLQQFEFEFWSNSKILEALHLLKEEDDRALLLFSHLLSSHSMWLSRLKREPFTCTLFQERTVEECAVVMQQNLEGWTSYLNTITDELLYTSIEFDAAWTTNERRKMHIIDALMHIIQHSAYHRGQIVASIKGKVEVLPLCTYIMYASEII